MPKFEIEPEHQGKIVKIRDMMDGQTGVIIPGEMYEGALVIRSEFVAFGFMADGQVDSWSSPNEVTLMVRLLPPGAQIALTV